MRATVTTTLKGERNPFIQRPGLGYGTDANLTVPATPNFNTKNIWKAFMLILREIISAGIWSRIDQRPQMIASTNTAQAVVTCATVVNGNTVTVNGVVMTAAQFRATQTLTFASSIAGDTVVIGGVTFTAVNGAVTVGAATFDISGGNTTGAASLASQVNAYRGDIRIYGSGGVLARSAAAVCTVFARTEGTAGNAITLTTTGGTITAGGATLASGAAAANNQFDFAGNDATTAASIAANLALSTTSLLSASVIGNAKSAVVTVIAPAVAAYVEVAGERLSCYATLTDSGGNRIRTSPPNDWSNASTATAQATSLCNCVNDHPRLKELVYADSVAGVVTLHERAPSIGAEMYVVTSDGTNLAVTATAAQTGGGVFGANASVLLESISSGVDGNAKTIATSGATLTITGALSRLAGGTQVVSTF